MPMSFELPKPSVIPEESDCCTVDEDMRWMRRTSLPISKEMMEKLSVGDEVTLTLKGKVISLEANEHEERVARNEIGVDLDKVELPDSRNVFEELNEDGEE